MLFWETTRYLIDQSYETFPQKSGNVLNIDKKMRRNVVLMILLVCGCVVLFGQNAILYNTNIIDVEEGKVVPGMTVHVKDGMIVKIVKAKKKIKKGQTDYTGTYLMPGLIDSHTHWGNNTMKADYMRDLAESYLADGVTTVRDAGGDARNVKLYKAEQDSGNIVGPDVYFSSLWAGPSYYGGRERVDTRGYATENAPWSQEIKDTTSVEHLKRIILEAKEFGCTGLKLYNDISFEMLKKIVPLCREHGLKVWGHFATFPADAREVVEAGVETVSHVYLIDGMEGFSQSFKTKRFSPEEMERRATIFKEMVRRGTILDATVLIGMNDARKEFVPRYVNEAYRLGVKIAAGTDWVQLENGRVNSVFMDELHLLVDSCRMSIPDVLRAATIVGAEILGQVGKLGVIREGAEADLIVLKSNPLESLQALRQQLALYMNGKKVK